MIRATGGSPQPVLPRVCARRATRSRPSGPIAETGARGEFLALGGPPLREGRSCRAFVARLIEGKAGEKLRAVGCPSESGDVAIFDASSWTGL